MRNEHAYGVNLKWDRGNMLLVEYLEARAATINRKTFAIGDEQYSVALRSGVNDPTAPPGGMLYNLNLKRFDL